MSHTPAPWVWDEDSLYSTAGPKDTPAIIVKHEAYGFASDADMALIAAAPDLLAAIKRLSRGSCFCEMGIGNPMMTAHSSACVAARAAIAKAEGKP